MQGRMPATSSEDGPQAWDDVLAERRGGKDLASTIDHFSEKLERLEGMMKTGEGRRLARERTERLRVFRGWWDEEVGSEAGAGRELEES